MAIVAIAKNFINLLYPLRCKYCKTGLDPLDKRCVCSVCIAKIKKNLKPYCASCGRSVHYAGTLCPECQGRKFHFKYARSAHLYEGVLKGLILSFKYGGSISLSKDLSALMIDFLKENPEILERVDAITFVPMRKALLPKREYNQSALLAKNISKEFDIPVFDMLEKIRSTKPQNELARTERLANLKGAIAAKEPRRCPWQTVLLIDDVMTTGATLDECSKALLSGGAKEIRCFTLSRGI
jgi:competence protein ComFC